MKNFIIYGIVGLVLYAVFSGPDSAPDIDVGKVLDVTADTLTSFEQQNTDATLENGSLDAFRAQLEQNLNSATPPLHTGAMGVAMLEDGSMQGYNDINGNAVADEGEQKMFTVEVDGEKNRLIATGSDDNSVEHSFGGMGTGMLTGFILGNMLSRQSAAGIAPSSLANRNVSSRSSYNSARTARTARASSRSSSGSHRSGK